MLFEIAYVSFACAGSQDRVYVPGGAPIRIRELVGAVHRIAEEQHSILPVMKYVDRVSWSVSWCGYPRETWHHLCLAVQELHLPAIGQQAQSMKGMCRGRRIGAAFHEVVPVVPSDVDFGVCEDRFAVRVGNPPDVISMEMAQRHHVDVGRFDVLLVETVQKSAAHHHAQVSMVLRPEAGVNEGIRLPWQQEATERQAHVSIFSLQSVVARGGM
jgi:hypothetical protein